MGMPCACADPAQIVLELLLCTCGGLSAALRLREVALAQRPLISLRFSSARRREKHCSLTVPVESVLLRTGAFAGTLFAAADERLRGLTRRYRLQPQRSMAYPRT